jgi:predicted aconitase with swiveling domain
MTSVTASRVLVPGDADGDVLALTEPLSFWGGLDPTTGAITDIRHPQQGKVLTGTILVLPSGRGSSSSSSVLAEAIRTGTAPSAIVLADADPIVALGAIVAEELYGAVVPVVEVADASAYATLARAPRLRIRGGSISAET